MLDKLKLFWRLKKSEKDEENKVAIMGINITIIIILIIAAYYIFFISTSIYIKAVAVICFIAFLIAYIVRAYIYVSRYTDKDSEINQLILVDEDGNYKREWNINGKISLLIGKNTKNNEVDIDLANTDYSYLISKQHAVLNFATNNWYIEDIGSSNGVGIKKLNDNVKRKLFKDVPYKLDSGDTIYIANTQLIIK